MDRKTRALFTQFAAFDEVAVIGKGRGTITEGRTMLLNTTINAIVASTKAMTANVIAALFVRSASPAIFAVVPMQVALHALSKNDAESCLLWIHQADQCVFDAMDASMPSWRLQLIGDLHAVLACVAAQSNELAEAEKFLATAYARHSQAEAFSSVCRDLILASRLAFLQGQTQRAQTLLAAAECQLVVYLSAIAADHHPLMDVIQSNMFQMTCFHNEQEPGIFKMPGS